jgi:hypothetical protein
LDDLHSGSWILGNYQIWIGHPQTNEGWEYVRRTRADLVEYLSEHEVDSDTREEAWESLYIAEGSDWFWWYGDDFTSENDADFDRLFRGHLRHVYTSLGITPPSFLDEPITPPDPGDLPYFEEPQRLINPQIDGETDYFYEWDGAGVYTNTGAHASMFESVRFVEKIWLGFDLESLFIRVDYGADVIDDSGLRVRMVVDHRGGTFEVVLSSEGGGVGRIEGPDGVVKLDRVAFGSSIEAGVRFETLRLSPNDGFRVWFSFANAEMELERHPSEGAIAMDVPDQTFEMRNWIV